MLVAVLSGFILALFAPWIYRIGRGATSWILALLPLGLFIYFATFITQIAAGENYSPSYPWFPSLEINLSFHVDGLSLLFALIISGVGTLIVLYGGGYLAGQRDIGRFFAFLLMFMASMLGVVLSNNVVTLFIFWELTSVSSFMLIGYYHETEASRKAALQALLVTAAGGLALLAGLILMADVGGSWEITELLKKSGTLQNNPLYLSILILVLLGAFTKSAQFPFHFWLPGAMAAPAPVSAYLHSATMVKAGIYLLARFSPALSGTVYWQLLVTPFGVLTMFLGAYIAWQQTDLKRILAYSTVSALGTLVMLLGLGTEHAIEAAIVFLVVHSLYKGSLFMVAGAVDHETGSRFVDQLGGLGKAMPITATAACLAALSMSGVPFFLGFIGKELIYEATLEANWALLITAAAVLANILTLVAAGMVSIKPFFGKLIDTPKHAHEAPLSMWLGPITLASLGLLLGIFSSDFIKSITPLNFDEIIVSPASSAILAETVHIQLHLFPTEISLILLLSAITIGGGIGVYFMRGQLQRLLQVLNIVTKWGPEQWYQWSLDGMMWVARFQTRILQSGYLRYYLLIIILTIVTVTGYTLVSKNVLRDYTLWREPEFRIYEAVLYLTILGATVMVVHTQSRLAAVASLGVVGFCISMIFILFGAPDLAMTQLSIETLSVLLLVLVLYRLPRFAIFSTARQKFRDAIVAILGGGLMTLLVLIVTSFPSKSRLAPYFAENSWTLAHGHNVVNVILVDFRGFDTMGEITVLSVAAIGVYGLLRLRLEKSERSDPRPHNITDIYPVESPTTPNTAPIKGESA